MALIEYQVLILKTGVRVPLGVVFRRDHFVRFGVPPSLVQRGRHSDEASR